MVLCPNGLQALNYRLKQTPPPMGCFAQVVYQAMQKSLIPRGADIRSFESVLSQKKETTKGAGRCRLTLVSKVLLAGRGWCVYSD